MKLEKLLENKLIYDGMDDHFYEPQKIILDSGEEITFSVSEGIRLIKVENQNQDLLELILNSKEIKKREVIPGVFDFRSKDDFTVYFIKQDNCIILFNSCETQPGRYKIIINYLFRISA